MAAIETRLLLDGKGCLRFDNHPGGYEGYLPVWPPGYSLRIEGGEKRVLDHQGRPVARVGDRVYTGGGEWAKEGSMGGYEERRRELGVPKKCTGTFWVITPPVNDVGDGGVQRSS